MSYNYLLMRKTIFIALAALAVLSCKKEAAVDGEMVYAITGEATNIGQSSVTLSCFFNVMSFMEDVERRVVFSTDPDVSLNNYSFGRDFDYEGLPNGECIRTIEDLNPGTTYYYRAVLRYRGVFDSIRIQGEVKSFTTLPMGEVISGETAVGGSHTAVISGVVDVPPVRSGVTAKNIWVIASTYKEGVINNEGDVYRVDKYDADDGRWSVRLTGLKEGEAYYYKAVLNANGETFYGELRSFVTVYFSPSEGEAIDMGLSVKWASCNIGAGKPSEGGTYFAWGETSGKEAYSQSNYIYAPEKIPDVLPLDADAAAVKLGNPWRMPTSGEAEELMENTLQEYGEYNGEKGYLFVSAKNSARLFFPEAGAMVGNDNTGGGRYWTSSYYFEKDGPYALYFDNFKYIGVAAYGEACSGYTIRPVYVGN